MDLLKDLHSQLNSLVWGPPMMILLIGAGLVLTWVTRGVQFRKLAFSFREVLGKLFHAAEGEGHRHAVPGPFYRLGFDCRSGQHRGCLDGHLLGGPGSLVWLLVSGVVGMATKYSEIAVALNYRERDDQGIVRGGAMYVLSKGLNMRWLGVVFAAFTATAAFGIGNMVQANSVADAAQTSFGVPRGSADWHCAA